MVLPSRSLVDQKQQSQHNPTGGRDDVPEPPGRLVEHEDENTEFERVLEIGSDRPACGFLPKVPRRHVRKQASGHEKHFRQLPQFQHTVFQVQQLFVPEASE